jgi:hypothetical protein
VKKNEAFHGIELNGKLSSGSTIFCVDFLLAFGNWNDSTLYILNTTVWTMKNLNENDLVNDGIFE